MKGKQHELELVRMSGCGVGSIILLPISFDDKKIRSLKVWNVLVEYFNRLVSSYFQLSCVALLCLHCDTDNFLELISQNWLFLSLFHLN